MARSRGETHPNDEQGSDREAGSSAEGGLTPSDKKKANMFEVLEFLAKRSHAGETVSNSDILTHLKGLKGTTLHGYLRELEDLELVEKVSERGQYRLRVRSPIENLFRKTEYENRRRRHEREKEAVALACIEYEGGDLLGSCCLICHGTSTEPLFRLLRTVDPSRRPERIITNSLPGILELLDANIGLTIVGGAVNLNMGGIKPLHPAGKAGERATDQGARRHPDEEVSTAERLGTEDFNTAILSCSSISPDGRIWCNDGMDEFRSEVLATEGVKFVVLADASKLATMSGGKKLATKIDLESGRTWLFVNDAVTPENEQFFQEFEAKLQRHFVRVPVSTPGGPEGPPR